jgi:hypothetical protein
LEILRAGHGRAVITQDNPNCADEMLASEREARTERRGLWASLIYALRDARHVGRLGSFHGTFQIVRGRIEAVRGGRDRVEIVLMETLGRRVVVRVGNRDRNMLGRVGGDPKKHVGRTIEARGFVVLDGGRSGLRRDVVIDVSAVGLVTLLEEPKIRPSGPLLHVGTGENAALQPRD